jgi:oligopeptide/dipeptide ABC transporter ATP-binding protein
MSSKPILSVKNVDFGYARRRGPFGRAAGQTKVLFDVSLSIIQGEILGLLGESGSGKSTLGRLMLGLLKPTAGTISYAGTPLDTMSDEARSDFRRKAQLIFQDPYSALDPMMTICDAVTEPLAIQRKLRAASKLKTAKSLLSEVSLREEVALRYPVQLSGGQRQRVVIARTLSVQPAFVVADEPVASLDVSIQAQILSTLCKLKESRSLSMLFISHDVSVVQYISDRIAVMYRGRIVELGPVAEVITSPRHPYTQALLSSAPGASSKNVVAVGEIETSEYSGQGCVFRGRCPYAQAVCAAQRPELRDVGNGHSHACLLAVDQVLEPCL